MRLHLRKFNQLLENIEKQVLNPEEKQIIKFYLNKIAIQKVFSLEEFKEFNTLIGKVRKGLSINCLLYTSPSPRDRQKSRMPSSA